MPSVTLRPAGASLVLALLILGSMTPLGRVAASESPVAVQVALDSSPAGIGSIREGLRRLRSDLALERWVSVTQGRPERREPITRLHASLLALPALEAIRTARATTADSMETLRLELLEMDLARQVMLAGVAHLDDDIAGQINGLEADVEDYPRPLTLKELDHWIVLDPDSLRVRMLESVRLGLWRDRLDPLFERRRTTIDSLAFALGYQGYTEFSTRLRRADPGLVLSQLFSLVRATDTMYQVLTRELIRPTNSPPLGRGSPGPHPTTRDLVRFEWTREFDRYVDRSRDLVQAPGGTISTSANPDHPTPVIQLLTPPLAAEGQQPVVLSENDVAALVVAIDPPDDVRLAILDLAGVAAARAALAAAGTARQRSSTEESSPEGRLAGSDLLASAAGHLHANMVSTPEWYESRRRLDREAGRDSDIARLSDANLARLIRWRLWCDLKWVRVELASGLLTELMRHRAGTALWMPFVFVPEGADEREIIRQIRGFARGIELTPAEAYDAFRPGADFLGVMDEARGVALAAAVEERLREELGPEWFHDPNIRADPIFQTGDGWMFRDDRELVRRLTGEAGDINFDPLRRRYERLFDWSEKLLEQVR